LKVSDLMNVDSFKNPHSFLLPSLLVLNDSPLDHDFDAGATQVSSLLYPLESSCSSDDGRSPAILQYSTEINYSHHNPLPFLNTLTFNLESLEKVRKSA